MTKITVFQNQKQEYMGFDCVGHAGFAFRGKDVVCAGISILVQNTVNAIENYTEEGFSCEADPKSGEIKFRFESPAGHDAELLVKTMILGLQGISASYGKKFLKIEFKEV
ncbi:MAG: ribosomal-processing cysteine protease Prp [Roseburia sp.]|nr:ribosomal-processing cysteine protease Prp [Roseburia sp.]